jgi:outer membrane protein TolC
LSFEDAIRLAVKNNPALRAAEVGRLRAQERVGEARAATLPQVGATGAYTVQGPTSSFQIPTPTGTQTVTIVPRTVGRADLSASLDTDLSGRQRSQRRIAQFGVEAASGAVNVQGNDLVFDVQTAYLEALRSQALVRVAIDAVAAAQEQLRVAQAQFRAGVVPQFDVLRASVQVENLHQNQLSAETRENVAAAALIQVLGIEPTTRLELTPLLPPVPTAHLEPVPAPGAAAPAPPAPPAPAPAAPAAASEVPPSLATDFPRDLEPALAQAYARRPELQQFDANIRQAQERVSFERKARLPNATINGGYHYTPDATGFSANKTSWDVSANFSISVFDAGLIKSRIRGAQDELNILVAQRDQSRQAIAREVRAALLNLGDAEARRSTAAANTDQAREALRIARVRYQAGVSTTVEVTDAEVALTQAQTNQVNAEYDVLSARAAVLRSLGQYSNTASAAPREG